MTVTIQTLEKSLVKIENFTFPFISKSNLNSNESEILCKYKPVYNNTLIIIMVIIESYNIIKMKMKTSTRDVC